MHVLHFQVSFIPVLLKKKIGRQAIVTEVYKDSPAEKSGIKAGDVLVLASAIQDREVGKLIGIKTFGKAKVQKVIPILSPEGCKTA